MVALNTRIDWTERGKLHGHSETEEQRELIMAAMQRMDWLEIPTDGSRLQVAMMPGLGINEAIKQLRLPKVSHIAISHELAPYGFYGIRAHYSNADVDVFLVDRGSDMFPVCMEVTEKGG